MMKQKLIKTLALLTALAWLAGCDEQVDYKDNGLNFDVDKDLQAALQQNRMPLLAVKLGCNACHTLEHRTYGPAWKEIGKRYRNTATFEYQDKSYPLAKGLLEKISHGGSGNWGINQMPATDPNGSSHVQLEKLVGFILELGKQ